MSSSEEKIVETEYDNDELPVDDLDELGKDEKKPLQESSEFALKMINSVIGQSFLCTPKPLFYFLKECCCQDLST